LNRTERRRRDLSIEDLRTSTGGSFIHSSRLPAWREISDIHDFFCIFDEDEVVTAIVHVGHCSRYGCQRVYREVRQFLTRNPDYAVMIVRQLNGCREELRRLERKVSPP